MALAKQAVFNWAIGIKGVAHQAIAACHGHELALKANQTTCRHTIFKARTPFAIADHIKQFGFTATKLFHDYTLGIVFEVNRQVFIGLCLDTVFFMKHHAWSRNGQLIAFTTHRFNQNRQVQLTTTRHFKYGVVIGFFETQGHVGFDLALKTLTQLTACHKLAFTAGQGTCVDHEVHGESWLVNFQQRQAYWAIW